MTLRRIIELSKADSHILTEEQVERFVEWSGDVITRSGSFDEEEFKEFGEEAEALVDKHTFERIRDELFVRQLLSVEGEQSDVEFCYWNR